MLEAALFMDNNELRTMIASSRSSAGKSPAAILAEFDAAAAGFHANARERFGPRGADGRGGMRMPGGLEPSTAACNAGP